LFALSAALTVLLLLEVVPSALAGLSRFPAGVERLDGLTRLGLRQGRRQWVVPFLGVLHTAASAALIAGIWRPTYGLAGAATEAAVFGWVLIRQLLAGDRGRALFAYTLFLSWALAVLVVAALRI
jgi:hypothetical protein